MTNLEIYQMITDKIIAKMEQGYIPWQKPWKTGITTTRSGREFDAFAPLNYISKKNYRGINYWLLQMNDFKSNYWLTFNQAKELGGCVKKGEKSTPVVFWKIFPKTKTNNEGVTITENVFLLKYYSIFNSEQIEGIEFKTIKIDKDKEPEFSPIDCMENIIEKIQNLCPISHGGNRAFYSHSDKIQMPNKIDFNSSEEYYSTLIHEIAHSTGHKSRLNRETMQNFDGFGNHEYSKEELVAEMTTSYVTGIAGMDISKTFNNSVSYIQGWLKKLKNDSKFIFWAAKQSELAANYILNVVAPTYENE